MPSVSFDLRKYFVKEVILGPLNKNCYFNINTIIFNYFGGKLKSDFVCNFKAELFWNFMLTKSYSNANYMA